MNNYSYIHIHPPAPFGIVILYLGLVCKRLQLTIELSDNSGGVIMIVSNEREVRGMKEIIEVKDIVEN